MPSLDALAAFTAASFVLFCIPGPAVAYIVSRSIGDGRATAFATVAGLELGSFVHVVAAAVGLSAVLATSATAFSIVKWLGAAYLIGVGVRTLLTRPAEIQTSMQSITRRRAFTQGVVVNVLNPKVALFFLSFLPQFIDPGRGPAWSQALVLGTVFTLLGCAMDGLWATLAGTVRHLLVRGRTQAFVRRWVSGSLFVSLGVLAARAHRRTA
jgi:threonine/homoserine/homoserine lactone efflux protein